MRLAFSAFPYRRVLGLILFLIVGGVLVLQVMIARAARSSDGRMQDLPGHRNNSWEAYFHRLLHLEEEGQTSFLTATTDDKELVILFTKSIRRGGPITNFLGGHDVHEILQYEFRSGGTRISNVSNQIGGVFSDGRQLWLLPKPLDNNGSLLFRWGDRICELIHSEQDQFYVIADLDPDPNLPGRTRTDDFLLIPKGLDFEHLSVHHHRSEIYLLLNEGSDVYYRKGLPIGSRQQAEEFASRYKANFHRLSSDEWKEMGWTSIRNLVVDPFEEGGPFFEKPFGFWFDDLGLCALAVETDHHGKLSFHRCRFRQDGTHESKVIPCPIPWLGQVRSISDFEGWFRVIQSFDGDVYIVARISDGRWFFFKWENEALRDIGQRASPFVYVLSIKFGMFIATVVVLPMIFLGLIIGTAERFWRKNQIEVGQLTSVLGSRPRRGIARLIDVSVPLTLIILSIGRHPDLIGWWNQRPLRRLRRLFERISFLSEWDDVKSFQDEVWNTLQLLTSIPFLWSLLAAAIGVSLVQIVWQARTGKTIGKWLLGLRTVQLTLRPCGLSRSLLRELLFFVDSLFLLSWVPGVLSMLMSAQSQRIGDLLAGTIVVRDPAG